MIWGTISKLTRVAHGVTYDAGRDEILGSEPLASSVVAFDAGANGQVPPLRVLIGPKTQLHQPWGVQVDDLHHELVVGDYATSSILVYPWDANGDVAPIRTISGVNTMMRGVTDVALDPQRNLIVAVTMQSRTSAASGAGVYTSHYETAETQHPGGIFIFDRTANGDVKPKRMIFGPHTGILATAQVEVANGKIFVTVSNTPYQPPYDLAGTAPRAGCSGPPLPPLTMGSGNNFVGVWNITDNGDVPPRFIIHGPSSQMVAPGGIAVNPKAGEVYVTDGGVGSTFTFLVPQAF